MDTVTMALRNWTKLQGDWEDVGTTCGVDWKRQRPSTGVHCHHRPNYQISLPGNYFLIRLLEQLIIPYTGSKQWLCVQPLAPILMCYSSSLTCIHLTSEDI